MGYNGGAAHSCSNFADLVIKNIQRFKAKLVLNRWIFFFGRIGKTRAALGRAAIIAHSG
jgi:hypothetical protein